MTLDFQKYQKVNPKYLPQPVARIKGGVKRKTLSWAEESCSYFAESQKHFEEYTIWM